MPNGPGGQKGGAWGTPGLCHWRRSCGAALLVLLALAAPASGQRTGALMGIDRSVRPTFEPRGAGVLFGPLDPAVKKWHIPYELALEYNWRSGQYTNYARDPYQRYVSTSREGNHFYDVFGNVTPRTWVVYDWRQSQPLELGSVIAGGSVPSGWFNNVALGGDAKGGSGYNITVGSQVRTVLTPLTFSKANFTGVQMDYAGQRLMATALVSRISRPNPSGPRSQSSLTNMTNMLGGRATWAVGDGLVVGGTWVNARNANTRVKAFDGDPLAGTLTSGQSRTDLSAIVVVLSDDSPDDGRGGATLFDHGIRLVARDFATGERRSLALEEVVEAGAEWPLVVGGEGHRDFISADGQERIVLNYLFTDPAYTGPDPASIVAVEFDYILANDFKIEIWSDNQTGSRRPPAPPFTGLSIARDRPVLFTVRRAPGNVDDLSNLQRVVFNYGLPTATQVAGVSVEGFNFLGLDFYGEWDRNWRYAQYPNSELFLSRKKHRASVQRADAWMFHAWREGFPWFFFGEAYAIDADYSTTAFLADGNGAVQYDNAQLYLYEFVDDNDDQDQLPDWGRFNQGSGDRAVFPGWDENGDFVSDFNQNDVGLTGNPLPDYEEPFLRYLVDRPEFLFGIDLNNNFWIDRFEDDDLADYPYKAGRRGSNFFAGYRFFPGSRLLLGRVREDQPVDGARHATHYLMYTLDRASARRGRWRFFAMLKRVEDGIADDRRASAPFVGAPVQPLVRDQLEAPDTWVSTLWGRWDWHPGRRANISHMAKWELVRQRSSQARRGDGKGLRPQAAFIGLVNKADVQRQLGPVEVQNRFKSEWLRRVPATRQEERESNWTRTFQALGRLPLLRRTHIQAGLERRWTHELEGDEEGRVEAGKVGETGDAKSTDVAVQLSMVDPNYQGFQITTQVGVRYSRFQREHIVALARGGFAKRGEASAETTTFITVYGSIP